MPGELFGAFGNKTTLGRMACFSIIIILFLPGVLTGVWKRALAIAILTLGMLLSNSMSSLAGGIVAMAILMFTRLVPRLAKPVFGAMSATAILWSLIVPFISIGGLTALFGRSSDVTGRGTFWPMAPGFILERPFFGYGYSDFFNTGPYSPAWKIWQQEQYFFTPRIS